MFAYQIAITPDSMQGRVDNTIGMLAQALAPVGPVLAGVVTEYGSGALSLALFASLLGLAAIIATTSKGIRRMRPIDSAMTPAR